MKKRIISLIISLVLGFIYYYLVLPAINIHSIGFWFFVFFILIVYIVSNLFLSLDFVTGKVYKLVPDVKFLSCGIIIVSFLILCVNFILSPLFSAKTYAKRISVNEDSDFISDVEEVDFSSLPLLDKESSQKLGDRVMGQMPELVSQFYVSSLYTQINYNNGVVRVTPLEYDGFIKYFSNKNDGIKGYITVDSVSGEANLVKLENGMKYMPSAMFNENLYRKLRFDYPTKIFGAESFEIDNEGNPYWVIPTIKYSGIQLKRDVDGVVILNPIDGSSDYYDINSVPTWVDNVYKADVILEQVNDWGRYKGGFWNSIFGQKNVVATTDGYNYIAFNDDVYLYTGITSMLSDEANIGFILTNMRTKETNFYSIPGAEEYSAMASSEGQVQQMGYKSTFPLLINLNGRPTYLMSLKDNAGLVKMYSFVDVVDYQKVVVSDASLGIEKASSNYLNQIGGSYISSDDYLTTNITIKTINSFVIDGNSVFYITDSDNYKYIASIKVGDDILPFLEEGDKITVSYIEEDEVIEVLEIK